MHQYVLDLQYRPNSNAQTGKKTPVQSAIHARVDKTSLLEAWRGVVSGQGQKPFLKETETMTKVQNAVL